MAKIKSPNQQYSGISASVVFVNGVGESTDPHLLDWFRSKGYTVELDAAELKLPVPDAEKDGEGSELETVAEEKEIDLGQSTSQKGKKILKSKTE